MRLPGPRQKSRTRGGGASDRNCRCEFVRPISHPECPHLAGQSAFPCHHSSELLIKPDGVSLRRLEVTLSVAKVGASLVLYMIVTFKAESASALLDASITALGCWRGRPRGDRHRRRRRDRWRRLGGPRPRGRRPQRRGWR